MFRDNLQNRMRKLCLLAPNGESSPLIPSSPDLPLSFIIAQK